MKLLLAVLGTLVVSTTARQYSSDGIPKKTISRTQKTNANLKLHERTSNVITDLNGRPVPSATASLTVGKAGPVLLQDVNLVNHLAHFVREKIPDRVVHAKGGGAHGTFEVTHDIREYTKAALFSYIGQTTPVLVRFSIVVYEGGSADTPLADPRGFAVKFYTEQGNWDLVGNNLIIFPIRDPILFPSLIRSRRNSRTFLRDPDAFWDFNVQRPETTFHTLQHFSDLGCPDGWRFMDGGGVHTFKLVNQQDVSVYCKFHWRTNQGHRNLTWDESIRIAGINPNYSIEDLYRAIERQDYPSWNLSIQVMTYEQAENFRWNPFDITKIWPEDEYPLIPVGKLTLNKNPVDYFTEIEMAAFDPGSLVPGIEASPDPMFHARMFSYTDTQRHRLGPNFQKLPINRPLVPVNSFDRDGQCAVENGDGRPNYFPNSFDNLVVTSVGAESTFHLHGDVVREDTRDDENFSQAKTFLQSLSRPERERLVRTLGRALLGPSEPIRIKQLSILDQVDTEFTDELRLEIGNHLKPSK